MTPTRRPARRAAAVLVTLLVAVLTLAGCGGSATPTATTGDKAGDIQVVDVWARSAMAMTMPMGTATPAGDHGAHGGGGTGAIYATIKNQGKSADRLVSVSTPLAATAEIHRSTTENGVAKMDKVDGIDVPAGGQVELKPGDYHVMLFDLHNDLKEGDQFTATLTFEHAGDVAVQGTVRQP